MKAGHPGPHPEPPDDLANRKLPIRRVNRVWFRVYDLDYHPIYFGRKHQNRFDAPAGEFGVLYMGVDEHCAFIETLGQNTGIRVVTSSALKRRGWAQIKLRRELALVDLVKSGGLARIGADARLFAGNHDVAQRWSKALWEHPLKPDGIYYPARHDPQRTACALYDRCETLVSVKRDRSLFDLKHHRLLERTLNTYGFGVIDA